MAETGCQAEGRLLVPSQRKIGDLRGPLYDDLVEVIVLKRIKAARQIDGEPHRVWYADDSMDLIVWTSEASEVVGFQIDYKTGGGEKALTWDKDAGFGHYWIDDGESRPGRAKMTPILLGGGHIDIPSLRSSFLAQAAELPGQIVEFIDTRLSSIGHGPSTGRVGGDQP